MSEAEPNVRGSGPVEGSRGNREVPPATTDNVDESVEQVDELAEATRQRDEYLDALQRSQAEFANYRKRVARDQASLVARAAERLVKELLPVLDDLERALEAANEHEEAKLEEGVRLVHRSLAAALSKEGLQEIETEGTFDPHTQEALLSQPSDEEEGAVIQVLQKGYRLGDRVLRPARVVVAAAEPPAGDTEPVEGVPGEPEGSAGDVG
jgi:molecular chaperone GrpE